MLSALRGNHVASHAEYFVGHAIFAATHDVYLGLAIAGVAALVAVLVTPQYFPLLEQQNHVVVDSGAEGGQH